MSRLPRLTLARRILAAALVVAAALLLATGSVDAADPATDAEMKRIEATLARLQQAQQSVYQQFQMVQELRRSELGRPDPAAPPAYGVAAPPGDYDELQRQRVQREQRLKDLQAETDRLYARYQALEEEKRPLLERMRALAQGQ